LVVESKGAEVTLVDGFAEGALLDLKLGDLVGILDG
jgi:hypothetical protein